MLDMLKQSRDEDVAESLARGMLRSGNRDTVDQLMNLLEVGNESQRRAIAQSLGSTRDVNSGALDMDRLVTALHNERDMGVRSELARSISRAFGDQGFEQVVDMMRGSPEIDQRHALLWGLEESLHRNQPRSRELFLAMARNDPAPQIRRHAVEIIQHRRDPSMIPALQAMLRDETNREVQERLQEAIQDLGERR